MRRTGRVPLQNSGYIFVIELNSDIECALMQFDTIPDTTDLRLVLPALNQYKRHTEQKTNYGEFSHIRHPLLVTTHTSVQF
jgi:hypothetical protein